MTEMRAQIDRLWRPLADRLVADRRRLGRTVVLGLCGPQGSGKSTGVEVLERLLTERRLATAVLSLDDLYLRRADRGHLADTVHPLLRTRGPPGTHEVALGLHALDALAMPGHAPLPRFDKAVDDRVDAALWQEVATPVDLVLFEGWCVGARPQPEAALAEPINRLEAEEDAEGVWRRYVNTALAGDYQTFFSRIDRLVLLRPPAFEVVAAWRTEQEHKLRAARGDGAGVMSDAEVLRFIQHYERLSRWIDLDLPGRADVVATLDAERRVTSVNGL